MKNILILLILSLSLFAGCSNTAINVDDGLTYQQNQLIQGNAFVYSNSITGVAVGGTQRFLGCTQNNPILFSDFDITFSVTPFKIEFYESPIITNNGTQVYGKNMNRQFLDTHELNVYAAPTITANGTKIFSIIEYGNKKTSGNANIGGVILKPNTCYLFTITNQDAAAADFNINFFWIEY